MSVRESRKIATDKTGKAVSMPFNSSNKYAFLILDYPTENSDYCLMTKGAPEIIWGLCTSARNNGLEERKDEAWEESFKNING